MDRQAERWTALLDNTAVDEDGIPEISETAKERIFNRLQAYVKDRQKLFPEEKAKEGPGVTNMRAWLNDPEAKGELEAMIRKIAGPSVAKPRPTTVRDKEADAAKAAGGSALHALVFGGEGIEEQPA